MTQATSTQIQLVSRPAGWPVPQDFRTVTVDLPALAPGQVRVRNDFISVDPYMRGRMNDVESYTPPFALGETMTGGAVGRVVASTSDQFGEGDLVVHALGWRDLAQGPAESFSPVQEVPGAPESLYLGLLGMTGRTAYVGLTAVAGLRPGDTVLVSGAAGAVGSAAGQFARLLGASKVVGSAGSARKVELLTGRYGLDAAFNYKDAPVREQLPAVIPEGVDVYYDNVGGDHLEAAIDVMNRDGRAALCGSISGYNAEHPAPGPDNLHMLTTKGLTLKGFTVGFYQDRFPEFQQKAREWFTAGRLVYDETVVDGLDRAVEGFLDMMGGGNIGKALVKI
ncbi:NADP-dependent oxidoreductase [Acidipropionibacterium virtanenii]|uniref:NADP-dependent oxidoreductase YfmJ n=1 Tax=Acidipropionibacterium virtanenii TaxID=2057246 RepID=A0A344UQR8_9ACTN|nr:NADP-dependent oxidoreductase [Acidipropionibacterium virtanenii]AXE37616.1 Putative NADP-dependent oxidoreductase YfmJ [Acidipropionibacterium virtanenii]